MRRLSNVPRTADLPRADSIASRGSLLFTFNRFTPQHATTNAVIYYASDAESLQYLDSVSSADHESNCFDDEAMDPALKELVPDYRDKFSVLPSAAFLFYVRPSEIRVGITSFSAGMERSIIRLAALSANVFLWGISTLSD